MSPWGLSACLCKASTTGSHLHLLPPGLRLKRTLVFASVCHDCNTEKCNSGAWQSIHPQWINLKRNKGAFFPFSVDTCLLLSCEFDGKHLKPRTPSLVTLLTRATWTTSCHYWKRKRQKPMWATSQKKGWLTFLMQCLFFPHPPFSPTEGFPLQILSAC